MYQPDVKYGQYSGIALSAKWGGPDITVIILQNNHGSPGS